MFFEISHVGSSERIKIRYTDPDDYPTEKKGIILEIDPSTLPRVQEGKRYQLYTISGLNTAFPKIRWKGCP